MSVPLQFEIFGNTFAAPWDEDLRLVHGNTVIRTFVDGPNKAMRLKVVIPLVRSREFTLRLTPNHGGDMLEMVAGPTTLRAHSWLEMGHQIQQLELDVPTLNAVLALCLQVGGSAPHQGLYRLELTP